MTANPNGWPGKPGVPANPERDGWHWVRTPDDQDAPYQWRAAGECERGRLDARWIFEAVQEWDPRLGTYLGPCHTPAEVAAARRKGAEAMREACAQDTDCGCLARADVLARLAEAGPKRASYLCPHGDVCCALQAAAIRALPIPEDKP